MMTNSMTLMSRRCLLRMLFSNSAALRRISGSDDDYLIKIRCENTRDLDRIISMDIKSLPGLARTRTTIVIETIKETSELTIRGSESESK